MSAKDDQIKALDETVRGLDGRVKSLESKFSVAVTIALFLGVSVTGLGAWVRSETADVNRLRKQVKELEHS